MVSAPGRIQPDQIQAVFSMHTAGAPEVGAGGPGVDSARSRLRARAVAERWVVTPVDQRLSVNTFAVAAEVIDGEAVIINLSDGMYFTMDGVGAEVWRLVEQGCSLRTMAACLAARYGVDEARVLADLDEVAAALLAAELVVAEDGHAAGGALDGDPPDYAKPELVSYSDMADVLALDPPLPVLDPPPEP